MPSHRFTVPDLYAQALQGGSLSLFDELLSLDDAADAAGTREMALQNPGTAANEAFVTGTARTPRTVCASTYYESLQRFIQHIVPLVHHYDFEVEQFNHIMPYNHHY